MFQMLQSIIRAICFAIAISAVLAAIAHAADTKRPTRQEITLAANAGDSWSQKSLGVIYELGGDLETAATWYKRSAHLNNARGQLLLGNAYQHGRGVPRDLALAFAWYSVAAFMCDQVNLHPEFSLFETITKNELIAGREIGASLVVLLMNSGNEGSCEEYYAGQ